MAALAEPVRRELYLYVVSQLDPVSRDQAAAGVGVARHTAKFHLDKLVEEGLLDTDFRRLTGRQGPGAGRPAKLYRRAAGEVTVSLPERRYDLAGQLMAAAIDEATTAGTPVHQALDRAAASFGAALGEQAGRAADPGDVATARRDLCDVLAAHGYEPRLDGARHPAELPVPRAGPGAHRPGVRHEPRAGRSCGGSPRRPARAPARARRWSLLRRRGERLEKPITIGPPGRPSPSSTRLQRTHFR